MASPSSWLRMTRMDVGVAQKESIFNGDVDLLDASLNGNLSIALAAADTLLTETQQCNGVIIFTGAIGAARTIYIRVSTDGTVNARPGKWVFFNNTTGGFALTFKLATVAGTTPTGFGSGATLTAAKKAGFYHTNPASAGASGDVFKWTSEV